MPDSKPEPEPEPGSDLESESDLESGSESESGSGSSLARAGLEQGGTSPGDAGGGPALGGRGRDRRCRPRLATISTSARHSPDIDTPARHRDKDPTNPEYAPFAACQRSPRGTADAPRPRHDAIHDAH